MEEDFPRGGAEKKQKVTKGQRDGKNEEDLFKEHEETVQGVQKKTRKERKQDRAAKAAKQIQKIKQASIPATNLNSLKPESLSKRHLYQGMTVLGYVRSIQSYSLQIALPNGLKAHAPITNISRAYRKKLEALAQAQSQEDEEYLSEGVESLSKLFSVGMLVPCKVMETGTEKKGPGKITVSLNPQDVNSDVPARGLQNNMVLYGSIVSSEDHGYMVDLGVSGVQAFIPSKQAVNYIQTMNQGNPLPVGHLCRCKLQLKGVKGAGEEEEMKRVITVNLDPAQMTKPQITDASDVGFSSIVAGMKIRAKVEQVVSDGLHVTFGGLKGCVHTSALPRSPKSYSQGDQVTCSVLSIHPLTKAICLTLHPHVVNYRGEAEHLFQGLHIGDVFEQATVTLTNKDFGVYFSLPEGKIGFAWTNELDEQNDQLPKVFKKGTQHKCRVVGFAPMEGRVLVSLKQETLDRKYMRAVDIQPGEIIKVTITKFLDKGVTVSISKGIEGFIPKLHMADVTLHHPEKKFEVGQMLKCKVMHLKKGSIILTHKKSLVSSKFTVPTDYEGLERGMDLEGFITSIHDFGVFVSFLNHVQGLVPRSMVSVEKIDAMEKVFYQGQVVKCRVVKTNPAEKKLTLTFKLEGKKSFGQKIADAPEDFEIGKIISCKIAKKMKNGLDVVLDGSTKTAFLPRMHLSDSVEMCNALWDMYQPGDIIEEVMFCSRKNAVMVTKKPSLLTASKENEVIIDFDHLKPGQLVTGWVQTVVQYGVFMEMPGQLVGLVPKQYVTDRKMKNLASGLYTPGQSLCAKIVEVHKEKQRYLGSLRTVDCYHGNTQVGLDILRQYLAERTSVMESLTGANALVDLNVGGIYKAVVKSEHDQGLILEFLGSKIKAVAAHHHYEGIEVSVGQEVDCAVLYVDLLENCVEVSLGYKLMKQLRKRRRKSSVMEEVNVGDQVKSVVELVKSDFILVSLKSHGAGQLAYLPAKKHLSDLLESVQFGIAQENKVVIKSCDNGVIVASLELYETKEKMLNDEEEADTGTHVPMHDLNMGDICTAVVRKVWLNQMLIKVANTVGRVHQTEIQDSIVNGNNPLVKLQKGMEIKVRVIGFRKSDTKTFLPLSDRRRLRKGMPECTMRPSILALKKFPKDYESYANNYKVGDKAVGFTMRYSGSCWWLQMNRNVEARLFALNMSEQIQELQHPETFCLRNKGYYVTILEKINDTLLEVSLLDKKAEVKNQTTCLGVVKAVAADRGLSLQLVDGFRGSVCLTDVTDKFEDTPVSEFQVDQVVQCFVLAVDNVEKQATLSLRPSRVMEDSSADVTDLEVNQYSDLCQGQVLRGYVTRVTELGVSVRLGREVTGLVACDPAIGHPDRFSEEDYPAGSLVTVKILMFDKKARHISLSLLETCKDVTLPTGRRKVSENNKEESMNSPKQDKKQKSKDRTERKRKTSDSKDETEIKVKKVDKKERKRKTSETKLETVIDSSDNSKKKKLKKDKTLVVTDKTEAPVDDRSGIDGIQRKDVGHKKIRHNSVSDSDSGVEVKRSHKQESNKPVLELEGGFSWNTNFSLPLATGEISSDDSDEEQDQKSSRMSKEEIRQQKKEEERKLFEYERQTLEGERQPETADDFDRLVLQSPNSSLIWLRYMAFHLETSEIDRARAVAERALKTISFVEEQEKLNVWVGFLNLENMYGSSDSLNKVLSRALQQADQIAVYTQMIDIYDKSNKTEEAERLFNIMVKKYGGNKDVWIKFSQFYFQHERLESARKLLQRCLKSLPNKYHVETLAKFAQMEFKFGEPERGKTMYDNILSSYPGRTDIWSVYLDMVTKLGDHTCTRNLYNKVVNLKMGAKKMKFFYKKFLQFEEKHGSKSQVDEVKKKALEYVESQGYVDE